MIHLKHKNYHIPSSPLPHPCLGTSKIWGSHMPPKYAK